MASRSWRTSAGSARTSSTGTSSARSNRTTWCSGSISLRALALLREPKKSRRRQGATRTVLRDLGPHPQSGAAMTLLEGRYGPYVTDGTTNASLPKGADPAALTAAEAVALLEARAGIPSKKRPARRAGGTRKAAGGAKAPRARKREPVEV